MIALSSEVLESGHEYLTGYGKYWTGSQNHGTGNRIPIQRHLQQLQLPSKLMSPRFRYILVTADNFWGGKLYVRVQENKCYRSIPHLLMYHLL